jgi:hypothetical protein
MEIGPPGGAVGRGGRFAANVDELSAAPHAAWRRSALLRGRIAIDMSDTVADLARRLAVVEHDLDLLGEKLERIADALLPPAKPIGSDLWRRHR